MLCGNERVKNFKTWKWPTRKRCRASKEDDQNCKIGEGAQDERAKMLSSMYLLARHSTTPTPRCSLTVANWDFALLNWRRAGGGEEMLWDFENNALISGIGMITFIHHLRFSSEQCVSQNGMKGFLRRLQPTSSKPRVTEADVGGEEIVDCGPSDLVQPPNWLPCLKLGD